MPFTGCGTALSSRTRGSPCPTSARAEWSCRRSRGRSQTAPDGGGASTIHRLRPRRRVWFPSGRVGDGRATPRRSSPLPEERRGVGRRPTVSLSARGATLFPASDWSGSVCPWPGRIRHPVPRPCRVDAAVEPRHAFPELAVGPVPRGHVVHRVFAAGDEPAVHVEGLLCRFCGCLRRCRAACGAVPPRSRAPSASLRNGARATLDLRASTAPSGSVAGRQGPALHNARHRRRPPLTSADDRIPAVSAGQSI